MTAARTKPGPTERREEGELGRGSDGGATGSLTAFAAVQVGVAQLGAAGGWVEPVEPASVPQASRGVDWNSFTAGIPSARIASPARPFLIRGCHPDCAGAA